MYKIPILALRVAQAVVTVAELGLTAYVAYLATQPQEYCVYDSFEDETNCYVSGPGYFGGLGAFLLFDCVWTILTLVVLTLVPLCVAVHPIGVTVLDGFAMLTWFAGAIGWAVIAAGAGFAIADAMIALAFIIWALFVATFVLNLIILLRGGRNGPKVQESYPPVQAVPTHDQQHAPQMQYQGQQPYPGQPQYPIQQYHQQQYQGQPPVQAQSPVQHQQYAPPHPSQSPVQHQQYAPPHPSQSPVQHQQYAPPHPTQSPVQHQGSPPPQQGGAADYYHQNPELAATHNG